MFFKHRDVVLSKGKIGEYIAAFAQNLIWFVVIPILAIFFLKDGPAFVDTLVKMAGRRNSQRLLRTVFEDLNEMVTHYVRTPLMLAGLALIVYTFVFWAMRLPYSFALSSIAGVLEFIPVVGPAVAAVVVLVVSFLAGYNHLVIMIIFLGCWRIVQDYVISPQLMKLIRDAPAGGYLRGIGRCGTRGSGGRISVNSSHGQPSHFLEKLAAVFRNAT